MKPSSKTWQVAAPILLGGTLAAGVAMTPKWTDTIPVASVAVAAPGDQGSAGATPEDHAVQPEVIYSYHSYGTGPGPSTYTYYPNPSNPNAPVPYYTYYSTYQGIYTYYATFYTYYAHSLNAPESTQPEQ